jgi:co-chaperonin GroES (HSP10)
MDPKQFKPLRDGVLVRLLPERPHPLGLTIQRENPQMVDVVSNQTDGNHGDYRRTSVKGIVIAVGPGKWCKRKGCGEHFVPTVLKPGQHITFTAGWDDSDGAFPGHALIQEADVWFVNRNASA